MDCSIELKSHVHKFGSVMIFQFRLCYYKVFVPTHTHTKKKNAQHTTRQAKKMRTPTSKTSKKYDTKKQEPRIQKQQKHKKQKKNKYIYTMKPDLKITGSIFTFQPVLKHAGTSVPKVGERIEIRDDGS